MTTFEEESLGNQAKRDYDFTAATVKLGFRGQKWYITGGVAHKYIYIYVCTHAYKCKHVCVHISKCIEVCTCTHCMYIHLCNRLYLQVCKSEGPREPSARALPPTASAGTSGAVEPCHMGASR